MKKITTTNTSAKQKAIKRDIANNKKISSFFTKKPSDSVNSKNKILDTNDLKNKRKIDELGEKSISEHSSKQRKIENNDTKIREKNKEHSKNDCSAKKGEKSIQISSPKKIKITKSATNESTSTVDTNNSNLLVNNVLKEKIISDEDSGVASKLSIDENLSENFTDLLKQKFTTNDVNKENNLDSKTIVCDKLPVNKIEHHFDSFDLENDFFDDIFVDDFVQNDLSLVELKRCIVTNVTKNRGSLNLSLKDSISNETTCVKCCDYWSIMEIEKGQIIVIQAAKIADDWIVDNNNGLVVMHPDILISGTSVVGGLFCHRQSILKEKFRGFESLPLFESNGSYMTVGLLVHNILQEVLMKKIETLPAIMEIYEKIISTFDAISLMFQCNMTTKQCRDSVEPYIPQIYKFIQRYMKGVREPNSDKNFEGQVDKIQDIEENIWLPKLGLKGKIDVSVEVKINSRRKIMPLELKTGKSSFSPEHKGQVILYTMMMSMIGQQVDSGLLLYLKENEMKEIKGSSNEKRDLIMLRNNLALFLAKKTNVNINNFHDIKELLLDLPEPIHHHSACGKCSVNHLCSMYLMHDEKFRLKSSSHPLKEISEKVLNHLKPEHIHYVMKWVKLHQIEEETYNESSSMKDVWTMEPLKREKKGSCICNLKTVHVEKIGDHYKHTFERNKELEGTLNDFTISDIQQSDFVIINTSERINISAGYVGEINPDTITVFLDRNLTLRYPDLIFHVDKYFSANISHYNRAAVSGLLINDEHCSRLRSIVIEKKPATFKTHLPRKIAPISAPILGRLNKQQQRAIFKILTAQEYVLLKGFPGTGKTRTLIALVELLVKIGKSVLITANTHSAVDNILIGLMEKKIDFLRLGSSARVHSSLSAFTENVLVKDCKTPEDLRTAYDSKKVVGVTCLGAYHKLFESRRFDMCLVDESTQAQQCAVLKPLYNSTKFVLVGDPEQLPPIAKSQVGRELGFSESLFKRLDSENNTVTLFVQYRMNMEIMTLANKITYEDQLEVGNESVGNATLHFKNNQVSQIWWMQTVLSTKLEESVIFLNTSVPKELESKFDYLKNKKLYKNPLEAAIVEMLVNTLKEAGLNNEDIGVIAPFRAQVNLVGKAVSKHVEVNTVDQYQGREKNIIIYSCTESSPQGCANTKAFHILDDHNRLTVAVTRAKHKLIIIGDHHILTTYSPFEKLIRHIRPENIINLFNSKKSDEFNWKKMIDTFQGKFDS